jgi:hypothetical protein
MAGFKLNYHDYLANAPGLNASENAAQPMSEADWNALTMEQQWGLMGHGSQGITVNQFDPRFQDLVDSGTSGGDNSRISVVRGNFDPAHNVNAKGIQAWKDPSQIHQGEGYYTSPDSNETADSQASGDGWSDWQWALFVAALGLGGYAAGGLGATGADVLAAAPGEGFGTAGLGAGNAGLAPAVDLGINGGLDPETVDLATGNGPAIDESAGLHFGNPSGGDLPYGTEMPNTYDPGVNPTDYFGQGELYYTPGLGQGLNGPSWIDRLLQGGSSLMGRLPSIASALGRGAGAGSHPGGGGGGGSSSSASAGGGGMGSPKGGRLDLAVNPYAGGKMTPVLSLQQYLRGSQ